MGIYQLNSFLHAKRGSGDKESPLLELQLSDEKKYPIVIDGSSLMRHILQMSTAWIYIGQLLYQFSCDTNLGWSRSPCSLIQILLLLNILPTNSSNQVKTRCNSVIMPIFDYISQSTKGRRLRCPLFLSLVSSYPSMQWFYCKGRQLAALITPNRCVWIQASAPVLDWWYWTLFWYKSGHLWWAVYS